MKEKKDDEQPMTRAKLLELDALLMALPRDCDLRPAAPNACRHKLSAIPPHRCKFCGADEEIVLSEPPAALAPSQTEALAANDGDYTPPAEPHGGFSYPKMVRKLVALATGA